jgi:hypothetical protein
MRITNFYQAPREVWIEFEINEYATCENIYQDFNSYLQSFSYKVMYSTVQIIDNIFFVKYYSCLFFWNSLASVMWILSRSWRGVLEITLCDKDCQWLAVGRWFSPGTPVSSANKTDHHDKTEILLKVALNTITLTLTLFVVLLHNDFI